MRVKAPNTGSVLWVGEWQEGQLLTAALDHAKTVLGEGSVRSRALFEAKTHPDFRLLELEAGSHWIKVDQIRELIHFATGKPQIAKTQVMIIAPADRMNMAAANALLKTLEEPTLETLLILVTAKPCFLPATIRSRCYWVTLRALSPPFIATPLALKIKDDLNRLQSQKTDPISVAMEWVKEDPKEVINIWLNLLHQEMESLSAKDLKVCSKTGWNLWDRVLQAKAALLQQNPSNSHLLLESLLIEYASQSR